MAALNEETIKYLTQLSRIHCSEDDEKHLLKDLQKILHYVEQLSLVDTEGAAPCNHVLKDMANVVREDLPGETMPREVFLSNAPDKIGGYIRVPSVIAQKKPSGGAF